MNNKISVVIPTMNRLESLQETIESYVGGVVIPDQIIIVDQTEDAKLRLKIGEMIKTFTDKVKIEYKYQNSASSTKARNVGLKMCKNDIIIFSDDDITVFKNTLRDIQHIMNNQKISLIAGINTNYQISKSKIGYLFGKKSFFKRNIGHVTKAMLGRFPEQRIDGQVKTEWAMGFFFVVRKSLIVKWSNYWDEKLVSYAYAEDLDFSYSYFKHSAEEGFFCILDERVIVDHRVSREWRVPNKKSTRMYVINRTYLSYKHRMGVFSRIMIWWCDLGDFIFRLLHKSNAKDLFMAELVCSKHRKEIAAGILKPEWYE
jgi:glycosyltransferase involved in cell wall biosynthesis